MAQLLARPEAMVIVASTCSLSSLFRLPLTRPADDEVRCKAGQVKSLSIPKFFSMVAPASGRSLSCEHRNVGAIKAVGTMCLMADEGGGRRRGGRGSRTALLKTSGSTSAPSFAGTEESRETAVTGIATKEIEYGRPEGRRQVLARIWILSAPLLLTYMPGKLLAENVKKNDVNKDPSILDSVLSIFDPEETTKQGKKLPKAYLKSARDVVKTLRDSFDYDAKDVVKFRRNADSAKGAIREYISSWRGVATVAAEESYQALERALRLLGDFYSKSGPTAVLPEDVRDRVLNDLTVADNAL